MLQCTYEIDPLTALLVQRSNMLDSDDMDTAMLVRTAAVRIKQLNALLMSYLDQDGGLPFTKAHFEVFHGVEALPEEFAS